MALHRGQVKGYNQQPWRWLVGAGSFVVTGSTEQPGELVFDYSTPPEPGFAEFPPPKPNDAGISVLVYGHMVDVVRRVSQHVVIGKAFKKGEYAGFHFALCRRDTPGT